MINASDTSTSPGAQDRYVDVAIRQLVRLLARQVAQDSFASASREKPDDDQNQIAAD